MKKLTIFTTIFAIILSFAIGLTNQNLDVVYAENENFYFFGDSEITTQADQMELELFVKEYTEDFANGQDKVSNIIDCINKSLKQIDQDIVCTVVHMSCHPQLKKDTTKYEFNVCITVRTTQLDKLEEIIKTAGKCGANGYSGVFYGIKERDNLIDNAIESAKQDAINKAKNQDKELEFNQMSIQDICCFEQNNKIVVKAMVKANFVKVHKGNEVITEEYELNQEDFNRQQNLNKI